MCTSFSHIYVDPQACTGCGDCMDVCPADCIEGRPKYIHMIDEFDCNEMRKCEACEEDAIVKTPKASETSEHPDKGGQVP